MRINYYYRLIISGLILICLFSLIFVSCKGKKPETGKQVQAAESALDQIRRRGILFAMVESNSANYFVYHGQPMGFQYDMLRIFASRLEVELKLFFTDDPENSLRFLASDSCDIIALDLPARMKNSVWADFSDTMHQTRQVLVQRRSVKSVDDAVLNVNSISWINGSENLLGKKIHIREGRTLFRPFNRIFHPVFSPVMIFSEQELPSEDLLYKLATGDIDFVICDEHLALVSQKFFPEIEISPLTSEMQPIRWAVKKNASDLLNEINRWLSDFMESHLYGYYHDKYFARPKPGIKSKWEQIKNKYRRKISPFDDIIRKYSSQIGWDWRLVASLIFQESEFDPDCISWDGAKGLMQLMPETIRIMGFDSLDTPEKQVKAGIKYLGTLRDQIAVFIPDRNEQIKFTLAAYNAGIAHVLDARRLAEKYGKDPVIWDDHVDFFMLNKSKPVYYNDPVVRFGYSNGLVTYNFVRQVIGRYENYVKHAER